MIKIAIFSFLLHTAAAASCLANATAPEDRKLLVNPVTGESYPVGVWVAQYSAGYLTNYIAGILIEELEGYTVQYGEGPGTVEGYYAIAGCSTPTNQTNRGCDPDGTVSYYHVHLECWLAGYEKIWEQLQKLRMAPKPLSSMGYTGFVSMYFTKREQLAAYEGAGLALDYYAGFDATWNEPWNYFDNPSVVNRSLMMRCEDSNFVENDLMNGYLTVTGDTGGVITRADGSLAGNCPDGYFWYTPKCRADPSKCILYFTGGKGWSLAETMMKATSWNIPMAIGVANGWSNFLALPRQHKSLFYWWVPDPSFLDMDPTASIFPPNDKQAWRNGDQSTAATDVPVHKIVSRDLKSLNPRLENMVDRIVIDMDTLNSIMLDKETTGDDYKTAACRWLQNNENTWRKWLPDETTCFATFGLYNTITEQFVENRDNREGLTCQACPSGTYSTQLTDGSGLTYICSPCPAGTSQSSGASLFCDPCEKGMYQDETGKLSCKRCEVGSYQDQEGSPQCIQCPPNSRTLSLGAVTYSDCGCRQNFIDVGSQGNLECAACQEGLSCPKMSTKESLSTGTHPLGGSHSAPQVAAGYFVKSDDPLQVYKCGKAYQCPGGLPQTCASGLVGVPCAECPQGQTWNDGCESCEGWRQVMWGAGTAGIFIFLTLSYYLMTSKVTAKASVLFTTTCAFGMLISLLQSIGIIGTMTVDFPVNISGFFSLMSIFLLDLDNFGFACFAGSDTPVRYIASVMLFPLAVAWLGLNWGVSQLFPKHRWDKTKVASCMGQVMQVGFSTMSAIALAPFMCYTHPNLQQSVLKYPNVICGTGEHTSMQVTGGLLLLIGVLGFLALCTFAAVKVPVWSATEKHHLVRCFRFLVFRFRLDSWWFGVPLLTRGPLISLPIVFATDYPGIQTIWVTFILLCFLACQALAWPWKVPLLNALDCWMSYCIMILVAASALYLDPIDTSAGVTADFVNNFSTGIMVVIFSSIGIMVLTASSGLLHRAAMGGSGDYALINLGKSPDPRKVAGKLKDMAELLVQMEPEEIEKAFDTLAVFDTRRITSFMTMMTSEIVVQRTDLSFGVRVSSGAFGAAPKASPSKRSSTGSQQRSSTEKQKTPEVAEVPK